MAELGDLPVDVLWHVISRQLTLLENWSLSKVNKKVYRKLNPILVKLYKDWLELNSSDLKRISKETCTGLLNSKRKRLFRLKTEACLFLVPTTESDELDAEIRNQLRSPGFGYGLVRGKKLCCKVRSCSSPLGSYCTKHSKKATFPYERAFFTTSNDETYLLHDSEVFRIVDGNRIYVAHMKWVHASGLYFM